MINIEKFTIKHPLEKRIGNFKENELIQYEGKIPQELLQFLEQEQRSIIIMAFFGLYPQMIFMMSSQIGGWMAKIVLLF